MIQAVLFDLDGVIVNTLHYHYLAWNKMFEDLGGSVSEHSVLLHEGRASREILPLLLEEAGLELDPALYTDFIERKREYFRSIVKIGYYIEAFDVLAELRARGFRTALVTATALSNMHNTLSDEQQALFDFLITGDEVPRAKPHPDPFLIAARHLGLPPERCLVVENAPLGIEAAKAAGMTCVAVETTLGKDYLRQADCIIHDIRHLLDLPMLRQAGETD
jgi:beta-phosphoglucomutase